MLSGCHIRLLSLIISLLAGVYFVKFSIDNLDKLPSLDWDIPQVMVILGSLLIWILIVLIGAIIWKIILSGFYIAIDWRDCLKIFGVSQFGKYLPGNIGHFLGRALLAKSVGISPSYSSQSMFLEMSWSVGIASALALFGLVSGRNLDVSAPVLFLFVIAAFFLPWLSVFIINRFFPGILSYFLNGEKLLIPSRYAVVKVCSLYLLTFFCVGLILDWHAQALFGAENSSIFLATVFFSWSWVAGYITPGAPAGLGVREAVLVGTLSSLYGPGAAVGVAVSLRLVTTLGDGIVFLVALLASRVASVPDGTP